MVFQKDLLDKDRSINIRFLKSLYRTFLRKIIEILIDVLSFYYLFSKLYSSFKKKDLIALRKDSVTVRHRNLGFLVDDLFL